VPVCVPSRHPSVSEGLCSPFVQYCADDIRRANSGNQAETLKWVRDDSPEHPSASIRFCFPTLCQARIRVFTYFKRSLDWVIFLMFCMYLSLEINAGNP
jgi:hypothetical protein